MTGSQLIERLHRLIEAGNLRLEFNRPVARVLLAVLALAAVAALAAAAWFAHLDSDTVAITFADLRRAYVNRVRDKIQVATDAADDERSRLGQAGLLRLRITVSPDGRLASTAVLVSSGNPAVDELALRTVRESAPFEPFPPAMRRYTTSVEINSAFQFK